MLSRSVRRPIPTDPDREHQRIGTVTVVGEVVLPEAHAPEPELLAELDHLLGLTKALVVAVVHVRRRLPEQVTDLHVRDLESGEGELFTDQDVCGRDGRLETDGSAGHTGQRDRRIAGDLTAAGGPAELGDHLVDLGDTGSSRCVPPGQ